MRSKSSMKRRIVWLWKWDVLKIMTNVVDVLITYYKIEEENDYL